MSVLDIGTGAGDVAMLAAAIVGEAGCVIGIDRNDAIVERARTRAAAAQLPQVRFEQADLLDADGLGRFDVVIGRYVLVHQADPVGFLRSAAALAKKGGRLAFCETSVLRTDCCSSPSVQLYDEVMMELLDAFAIGGAEVTCGTHLVELFAAAGLPEPLLLSDVAVGGPASSIPDLIVATWNSLLPVLAKAGRPSRLDPATTLERIRSAATASRSQLYGARNTAAWASLG